MVFFALGAMFRTATTSIVAAAALLISFGIEFLKLNQAPWLVELRGTGVGGLVFGHVFSWQNLVAYTVGVALGIVLDRVMTRQRSA